MNRPIPASRALTGALASCAILATLAGPVVAAADEQAREPPVVLENIPLGKIEMENPMFRARTYTMPPGYKTPSHEHDGPGIRYVLEGEITIYWKDGTKTTYGPGQTFFEGRGENHPPNEMSAANDGEVPVKVFIVDIHPGE